jgi:hypothetical protein
MGRCVLLAQYKFLRHAWILAPFEMIEWFKSFLVLTSMPRFALLYDLFDFLLSKDWLFLNAHHGCWRSSHAFVLTIIRNLTWKKLARQRAIPLRLPFHLGFHDTQNMIFISIHPRGGISSPWLTSSFHKTRQFILLFLKLLNVIINLANKLFLFNFFVLFYEVLRF